MTTKAKKQYLVFDIGCIECEEESAVVGVYTTRKKAKEAINKYITGEENEHGFDWGRKDWGGQHSVEIFEL